jgi:hypothetical protein
MMLKRANETLEAWSVSRSWNSFRRLVVWRDVGWRFGGLLASQRRGRNGSIGMTSDRHRSKSDGRSTLSVSTDTLTGSRFNHLTLTVFSD